MIAVIFEVWPADGGRVSLNIASESLLQDVLAAQPAPNLMVEVPAFMAGDAAHTGAIQALHERGNTLLIKGRPLAPLPRWLPGGFRSTRAGACSSSGQAPPAIRPPSTRPAPGSGRSSSTRASPGDR